MARTKDYQHFCAAARSLEVVGEKWSLLIVRDLLRGPQRFTDLLRYLSNITPKWLTIRLRQLEGAGIVERDVEPGRREVWYRLTAKGRDLEPALEALTSWGIRYALRPPLPGETIHPEHIMMGLTYSLNDRGVRLPRPVTWVLRFPENKSFSVRFDGEGWSMHEGEDEADVVVETTPEAWVRLRTAKPAERRLRPEEIRIEGPAAKVAQLMRAMEIKPNGSGRRAND